LSPAVLVLVVGCAEAAPPTLVDPDLVVIDGVEAVLPASRDRPGPAAGPSAADASNEVDRSGGAAPLEVSAARSTWDLRTGALSLTGEVVATRGSMRLVCGSAEVRFGDDGQVVSVEARDDVVLTDRGRVGRAQEARLEARLGQVVLTGDASLAKPPHRMRGEPITVFLDDERVECSSCELLIDGKGLGASR